MIFSQRNEATLSQKHVRANHPLDIDLAVVTDDEKIRIFAGSRILGRLDEPAQPVVNLVKAVRHLRAEEAGLVAVAVDVCRMNHQKIRLVIPDDTTSTRGDKFVAVGMNPVFEHPEVRLDAVLHDLLRASAGPETMLRRLRLALGPVFIDEIVDRRTVSRHRPEDSRRGESFLLRPIENRRNFYLIIEPVPVRRKLLHIAEFIIYDAVTVRIAARHHRGMAGVGEGRINAPHLLHPGGLFPDRTEDRQLFQSCRIFINQRVLRNNNHMFSHKKSLLSLNPIVSKGFDDLFASKTVDNQ